MRSIAAVTRTGGLVALLMGDAEVGSTRVDAGEQVVRLGDGIGLRWVASAAQQRPEPRGGSPRWEHLILLQREPRPVR
jgi:hypothetical protein